MCNFIYLVDILGLFFMLTKFVEVLGWGISMVGGGGLVFSLL